MHLCRIDDALLEHVHVDVVESVVARGGRGLEHLLHHHRGVHAGVGGDGEERNPECATNDLNAYTSE